MLSPTTRRRAARTRTLIPNACPHRSTASPRQWYSPLMATAFPNHIPGTASLAVILAAWVHSAGSTFENVHGTRALAFAVVIRCADDDRILDRGDREPKPLLRGRNRSASLVPFVSIFRRHVQRHKRRRCGHQRRCRQRPRTRRYCLTQSRIPRNSSPSVPFGAVAFGGLAHAPPRRSRKYALPALFPRSSLRSALTISASASRLTRPE